MKKLCYVATIPAAINSFLRAHIQAAAEAYEVTVICNSVDNHLLDGLAARLIFLPIERKPSLLRDALAAWKLYKLFRHERFDIVHSILPKTGFMAMLMGWLAFVPCRVHTFTGQVWVTHHGVKRMLLKWFDKLIGVFATAVLADSSSQRDFLVNQGVLRPGKVAVIGAGSICGVDPFRFRPDAQARQNVRAELGVSPDARMILFVGRLNRDKGMLDLSAAFFVLAKEFPDIVLLLVGAEENTPFREIQAICNVTPERLHYVPFTSAPERYMAAVDILCQPSYREGFGMTLIEAAACGVPAVASRIYGIVDAVEDGETGLLFEAGNVSALIAALSKFITDDGFRQRLGNKARLRALELFSPQKITGEMMLMYENCFNNANKTH
jgi:glycosyltransferase involved in cell wall biosynthesis